MKVLFLDVDGVLNNDLTKEKVTDTDTGQVYTGVDKNLCRLLVNWLLDKHPEVSVVLSSTWRLFPGMLHALKAEGLGWIDTTSNLYPLDRGDEINEWLSINHDKVTGYAVLDDNLYNIPDRHYRKFVQTNSVVGLTSDDLIKLSSILE